jgi:two-component system NarL family response regulator
MVAVFIVEDEPRMLEFLREALESDPRIVVAGAATSRADALAQAAACQVDVGIVDLALGEESGIDLIGELKSLWPATLLMAHTVFDDRDTVFRALRAGASSYVLKGASPAELTAAVHEVKNGGAPMTPKIARMVIEDLQRGSEPDPITPRERQILKFIDEGLTYKEIAAKLAISVHTVHSHIKSVYERLHASGKREALARARSRGLL